jgi:hypothetical protein
MRASPFPETSLVVTDWYVPELKELAVSEWPIPSS